VQVKVVTQAVGRGAAVEVDVMWPDNNIAHRNDEVDNGEQDGQLGLAAEVVRAQADIFNETERALLNAVILYCTA